MMKNVSFVLYLIHCGSLSFIFCIENRGIVVSSQLWEKPIKVQLGLTPNILFDSHFVQRLTCRAAVRRQLREKNKHKNMNILY